MHLAKMSNKRLILELIVKSCRIDHALRHWALLDNALLFGYIYILFSFYIEFIICT